MNSTSHLVHLVRAPRSAIVHISKHGEQTLCGRDVRDSWSTELIEPAGAVATTTCDACRVWAGPTWTEQRAAADAYPENLPTAENRYNPEDEAPATQELAVDRTPLTLLVVPCSAKKLDEPAPARELYRGTLTTMGLAACSVVEGDPEHLYGHTGTRTMILSALHGLVDPEQVLAPYDVKMGDSASISTERLAQQLRETGATRLVALTPNSYTDALAAACELAGVQLVRAFEGCRGIGDQRGRLAQLRRGGGYRFVVPLGLESRRVAQAHADALEEDAARTAAAQDNQQPVRCEAAHDAGQPHALRDSCMHPHFVNRPRPEQLAHLMDDLFALCGARGPVNGTLHVTPVLANVTCPDCRVMIPGWLEMAHSEALRENAAHDAAMQNAQNLTPEMLAHLTRPVPPRLPQTLRNRSRRLVLVPPQAHA